MTTIANGSWPISRGPRSLARGFTLIELMIVVAIIGLLASVALPQYMRATIRSRTAERATILDAVARGANDVVANTQGLPTGGANWAGIDNPPGPATPQKRLFDYTRAGWEYMPVIVQGAAFYSYSFVASDPAPKGQATTLSVTATGDLDGDGTPSAKTIHYTGQGYVFAKRLLNPEVPPAGMEDQGTF